MTFIYAEMVVKAFEFLVKDYGFVVKILSEKSVCYSKINLFIFFNYSSLQEVSLSIGVKNGKGDIVKYGLGSLVVSNGGGGYYEKISHNSDVIYSALMEQLEILKKYAVDLLVDGDDRFHKLEKYTSDFFTKKEHEFIRCEANALFQQRKYQAALQQYRLIGDGATLIDKKKMKICERLSKK